MTSPALQEWPVSDPGYRRSEVSAILGSGDALWERVAGDVLQWKVKTASGFTVEVVAIVRERDRVGFAYRTRAGHPVSGEEAFIVERCGDDVRLTIRSLTRAAPQQPWRMLFPALLIAQRIVRRRYLRSLL